MNRPEYRDASTMNLAGNDQGESSLYDAYIELLAQGRPEAPEAFLDGKTGATSELLDKLSHVYRSLGLSSDGSQRTDDHRPAETSTPPGIDRLGEYRILELLGSGGMGLVYLAEQEGLARKVALKVIRPELAPSQIATTRFLREARAVAALRHPNIVTIYAVGEHEGAPFMAMEFIEGRGLDEILEDLEHDPSAVSVRERLTWFAELADALEDAHRQGIVHRDLKPANIRIRLDGRPILLDFGLARDASQDSQDVTRTFLGSPFYMAPEQIAPRGEDVDPRTDVYGLGVTMYQCLSGRVPFRGLNVESTFRAILETPPPALRKISPHLSRDVEVVVAKCLEKEKAQRYSSAKELADDLRAILDYRSIHARPPSPWVRLGRVARRHPALSAALGTAILVGLVALGFWVSRSAAAKKARAEEATQALAHASDLLENQDRLWREIEEIQRDIQRIDRDRFTEFMSLEDDRRLDRFEEDLEHRRRLREESLLEAFASIENAVRAGASPESVREVRARLYLARLREAEHQGDTTAQRFFRERVRDHDPLGHYEDLLGPGSPILIQTNPPGAQVHLFGFRKHATLVEGGEPRLIPVPYSADQLPVSGAPIGLRVQKAHEGWCAEDVILQVEGHSVADAVFVVVGGGEIARGERLIAVDSSPVRHLRDLPRLHPDTTVLRRYTFSSGGAETYEVQGRTPDELGIVLGDARRLCEGGDVDVLAWKEGELTETFLPAGLSLRPTATFLYVGEASHLGSSPQRFSAEAYEYLILLRMDGYEDQRLALPVSPTKHELTLHVDLVPAHSGPDGFIRILDPAWTLGDESSPFWIMDQELSFGDYLAFLNDEKLAREDGHYIPRNGNNWQTGGHCPRGPDGELLLPIGITKDHPVFGISWNDAQAYLRWRNEEERKQGGPWVYTLPTLLEWSVAGFAPHREFVFGSRFRHKWASTCYSRPDPTIETRISYPIDESAYGIFDMTGSVSEWLASWWVEGRLKHHAGGSWGDGGPLARFRIYGGHGDPPDFSGDTLGFRLVARRRGPP